jgi:hypothetical protein
MNIFWSILVIIAGISSIIYTYKNTNLKEDDSWDKVMTFRGYAGGILFIVIGIVTLIKGW